MQYVEIPYVDKKVSRIFYGTAMDPFQKGKDGSELLDAMYELGINTFDTARVYGDAERSLGNWIAKRGLRDQVVILSKGAQPDVLWRKRVNEKEIRKDFAKSSEELQTDFIDIYLLHRDNPAVDAGGIVEVLNAMHAEGKIGAFGGSNWTHQRIEQANEYAYKNNLIPFTVSSPNFGLAEQVCDMWGGGGVSIAGPNQKEARRWYEKTQMPVIAYSSLGRGMFSGRLKSSETENVKKVLDKYARKGFFCPENVERLHRCEILAEKKGCLVSQLAMAYVYSQKMNTFAVVATSSPKRMEENIAALSIPLTEKEAMYLNLEWEII